MKLCMVGSGYVGLVSGACFAETGQPVICADVDQSKIDARNGGEIPIFEPGLDEVVARNVEAGRLEFTTDVERAIAEASVVFVAVGTPPRGDGGADLTSVDAVAQMVVEREAVVVPASHRQRVIHDLRERPREGEVLVPPRIQSLVHNL